MRTINTQLIAQRIKELCLTANTRLTPDLLVALKKAAKSETSSLGREILAQILENAAMAQREKLPLCQDTGTAVVFLEIGQEVRLGGGNLVAAVNAGVRSGYKKGFLRKSIVQDPLARKNTGNNTPAIIHTDIVPGNKIKIGLLCKGGGAENRSAIKMFNPTSSQKEITEFILETVKKAGPNACPPLIVGVGIGSNFDGVASLAKKALLRPVGKCSARPSTARWEKELLTKINRLGIGPMGLGGKTTALAVNLERRPCHISSLPVAVNLECHAHRYQSTII